MRARILPRIVREIRLRHETCIAFSRPRLLGRALSRPALSLAQLERSYINRRAKRHPAGQICIVQQRQFRGHDEQNPHSGFRPGWQPSTWTAWRDASEYIAPLIPMFTQRHPNITVDLGLNDRFVDLVDEGWDLAIRVGRLADSRLLVRKLADSDMVICAAPGARNPDCLLHCHSTTTPQVAQTADRRRPPASLRRGTSVCGKLP
jgi:hypothetical protein